MENLEFRMGMENSELTVGGMQEEVDRWIQDIGKG